MQIVAARRTGDRYNVGKKKLVFKKICSFWGRGGKNALANAKVGK